MKWFKVNTDGAARQDEKLASSGGVIWDWNGQWVIVFAGSIGPCTALEAENDGLNWARKLGLRKVILELENASDVHLLKNPNSATLNTTSLRSIAAIAMGCLFGLLVFREPPLELQQFVRDDDHGTSWPRPVT
ncbi:hypothetical protein PVK06_017797 [Gossypium arboreum]|uniref:RNase H type-1 domain-containing protein n=1 Tax=Gossypium arboreum TaxID=29729 RepID=A0ABR0Q4F7_GOSAR|nr:hypothetical protein PVK06_017797 [Gossypium arboreum]